MAKQPETLTATEQTKINAAPTVETTAGDPRRVETVNAPLVFNDGSPVTAPDGGDDKEFTLFHPGGTRVTVRGTARRDDLLQRGYTTSRPERAEPDATVAVAPAQ